jgi:hypothetical protein
MQDPCPRSPAWARATADLEFGVRCRRLLTLHEVAARNEWLRYGSRIGRTPVPAGTNEPGSCATTTSAEGVEGPDGAAADERTVAQLRQRAPEDLRMLYDALDAYLLSLGDDVTKTACRSNIESLGLIWGCAVRCCSWAGPVARPFRRASASRTYARESLSAAGRALVPPLARAIGSPISLRFRRSGWLFSIPMILLPGEDLHHLRGHVRNPADADRPGGHRTGRSVALTC